MNHLAPVKRYGLRYALIILVLCYRIISVRTLDILKRKNSLDRRSAIAGGAAFLSCPITQPPSKAFGLTDNNIDYSVIPSLTVVTDPKSYSALSYSPPKNDNNANTPLILVLHGAGKNDKDILQDLANPIGEHFGLIPGLIASQTAPSNLLDNFCVLAPYSFGKPSFYDDPRGNLLQFVDWAIQNQGTEELPIRFDPRRIILFGFSDGATVAVELLTTKRFAAGVICSYGYSGKALPPQALERLANLPIWVFHSSDDVIFDVGNSDRLVQQLEKVNGIKGGRSTTNASSSIIKYSRYNSDPENLPPRVKGHSMGITASKSAELYDWMMRQVN
jgi:predicted peptidase